MKEKNITATQLAKDICCTRHHIHKIFRSDFISTATFTSLMIS